MYTRSFNRMQHGENQRYTPPPGYVGNAFSEESGVKHHVPEVDVHEFSSRYQRNDQSDRNEEITEEFVENDSGLILDEASMPAEKNRQNETKEAERSPLAQLVESLHGKIGTEELIILMTMLLISSDGIGVEVLILALILIAGNESK